jgi:uncharacterized membrane protein
MQPAVINYTLYQGTTFKKSFQWLSGSTPTNLTGCTIKMQVRATYDSELALELTTPSSGITIVDAVNGEFEILIAPAQSQDFTNLKYLYDIEITFPNSTVFRVIQGELRLSRGVTR